MPKAIAQMRLAELTAIKRPLTEDEITELLRLKRAPYFAAYKRNRYAKDPAFREYAKAQSAAYLVRKREAQP